MKIIINRIMAIVNLVFVIFGLVFTVPSFAISGKSVERALASNDVEKLGSLVKQLHESQTAYGFLFLICFVLLTTSAVFLWRSTK
jgi:hypothetical protein